MSKSKELFVRLFGNEYSNINQYKLLTLIFEEFDLDHIIEAISYWEDDLSLKDLSIDDIFDYCRYLSIWNIIDNFEYDDMSYYEYELYITNAKIDLGWETSQNCISEAEYFKNIDIPELITEIKDKLQYYNQKIKELKND